MPILIDANTEYVEIADNAKWTWNLVTEDRSFAFRWKTTTLPPADTNYQVFIRLIASSYQFQAACFNNAGTLGLMSLIMNGATPVGYFFCASSLSADTDYNIVYNCSSNGNCSIYLNEVSQSLSYGNWVSVGELNFTSILLSNNVAIYDDMTLSHIAVIDDLLTPDEITAYGSNPYSILDNPDLICYLPLNEQTGTTAYDQVTSNPTNGTLTGGPTWATDPLESFRDIQSHQHPRYDWAYSAGVGDQDCPDTDGTNTVCRLYFTGTTSDSVYSDANLQEDAEDHDGQDKLLVRLRTNFDYEDGDGTWGAGIWDGDYGVAEDVAWFWWGGPSNASALQGLHAHVMVAGETVFNQVITGIDITEYHIYEVNLHTDYVTFLIDDEIVAQYDGGSGLPTGSFRCEVWMDNAYYPGGERQYLELSGQELYVDWLARYDSEAYEEVGGLSIPVAMYHYMNH